MRSIPTIFRMPTVTRLMSIQCEGNRGELLKITTKHTILTEADNASFDSSKVPDGTAYTLPPANGLVPLQLQVRVDRKLLSADELGNSCLLAAIVSFLNTVRLLLSYSNISVHLAIDMISLVSFSRSTHLSYVSKPYLRPSRTGAS